MLHDKKTKCDFTRKLVVLMALLLVCIPGRTLGQTNIIFNYAVNDTNVTVTHYIGPGGTVTIPSSIPGVGTVTSIGNWAFETCTTATNITIPNSVTSIGDGAFRGCTRLTSITIPNSVTSIGIGVFSGCTSLPRITLPDSVNSIGMNMFEGCTSLTSITLPSSITSIGNGAFGVCANLTSITLPNSLTSIGTIAFIFCAGLTNITIPNSVTSIGDGAFEGCTSLTRAYFQGNAPSFFSSSEVFGGVASGFTIYYPFTASGWSTPYWNGYPAQPYTDEKVFIAGSGNTSLLSWPLTAGGYVLETSTTLAAPAWETVTNAPLISAGRYVLTNSWSDEVRFFRLRLQ